MPILRYLICIVLCLPSAQLWGSPPGGDQDALRPEKDRLLQLSQAYRGDPDRGKELFHQQDRPGCVKCHQVDGQGGTIGPSLSDVGGKLDRAHLLESLIDPSRQIVEGYRSTVVILRDGRVLTGLVHSEDGQTLTLVDSQQKSTMLRNAEIEQRQFSPTSIMPDGWAAELKAEEILDLVAYLETLRSSGQPSPGSGITGPVVLPPGFHITRVAGGLTGCTALAIVPDRRVLVCEQPGRLRVIDRGALLPRPMLVVAVDDQWERGLLGVAVDPEFEHNSLLYICYVAAEPYPHHRISRFTVQQNVALAESEQVLLRGDDQRALGGSVPAGHQGGGLHFGTDGMLYVALGEQTAGAPAQSLQSLLGKILRLKGDGSIPDDNPFVDETHGKYRAIWALGLRNPFTFAIQQDSGRMLINDVGGQAEEINLGVRGGNYGWPAVEHGPVNDPGYLSPVHWYPTASISGGAFCPQESPFPEHYRGKYFFMDFVRGWIHVLDPASHQRPIPAAEFASGLARPVDLAFSSDGSLYVLVRDAWVRDQWFQPHTGALYRIWYQEESSGQGERPQ